MRNHPTGFTGVLAAALVLILSKFGVTFTAEEAAIIIGAVVAVVSAFTPRVTDVILPLPTADELAQAIEASKQERS